MDSKSDPFFDELRAREFPLLGTTGLAYLDYTGAALPAVSHLRAHEALVTESVFGNPHAEHAQPVCARARTRSSVRARSYDSSTPTRLNTRVCFTANATAAVKLVAESFPLRARWKSVGGHARTITIRSTASVSTRDEVVPSCEPFR